MSITSYERQGTSTKKSPNPASGISRVTSLLTQYTLRLSLMLRTRLRRVSQ